MKMKRSLLSVCGGRRNVSFRTIPLLCIGLWLMIYMLWYFTTVSLNVFGTCEPVGTLENIDIYLVPYENNGSAIFDLRIINGGEEQICITEKVTIHACFIRPLKGFVEGMGKGFTFGHISGCYHKLTSPQGLNLHAGGYITIRLVALYGMVSYSDYMPNWYIQRGEGSLYHQIRNTNVDDVSQFVGPFANSKMWKRGINDMFNPWSAANRYDYFTKTFGDEKVLEKNILRTLPSLAQSSLNEAELTTLIDTSWKVNHTALLDFFNVSYQVTMCTAKCIRVVQLKDSRKENTINREAYSIVIDAKNDEVIITGHAKGVRNAGVTLQQLYQRFNGHLPDGSVYDKPRFEYRGYMMDIARNFQSVQTIKKYLKIMSYYKLNTFHFHLTDDEAWRLQIIGLEELTEIGARICFDENRCLLPQLGNKADSRAQYITKEEYIDLVKYADTLGITILPEFDMPGHSHAAVKAMFLRYDSRNKQSVDYRLSEKDDSSRYQSTQYYNDNAINPCLSSTFQFIQKVINTVKTYHMMAGVPLKLIHLGGDEVAHGAWMNSTSCHKLAAELGWGVVDAVKIKAYYLKKIGIIAEKNGLNLAFWDSGLFQDNVTLSKTEIFPEKMDVYAFWWQNVWEWLDSDQMYNLAKSGYKIVQTPATNYYLDHPYEAAPEEVGLYWATRYISNYIAFRWKPDDVYSNIEGFSRMGEPLSKSDICKLALMCSELLEPINIVGIQATQFGEVMRSEAILDHNAFPRLLSVAERAWHKAQWEDDNNVDELSKDFASFTQTLGYYELPTLRRDFNTFYHLSPPAAKLDFRSGDAVLRLLTEYPGEIVEYNDGIEWQKAAGNELLMHDSFIELRTTRDGQRSRTIKVTKK